MSNQSNNRENVDNALESLENTTDATESNEAVDVEVVKGDKVIYEDGDFEDFNAEQDLEPNNTEDSKQEDSKQEKFTAAITNIYHWAAKLKEEFIPEKDKNSELNQDSDSEAESDKKSDCNKEEDTEEDKHSVSIANIYQWATKLKEDFASEAANMTHDMPEKALGIMLDKLLSSAEAELKAFDNRVEQSEEPIDNAEQERSKIEAKKEKYQGMIDLLNGE